MKYLYFDGTVKFNTNYESSLDLYSSNHENESFNIMNLVCSISHIDLLLKKHNNIYVLTTNISLYFLIYSFSFVK